MINTNTTTAMTSPITTREQRYIPFPLNLIDLIPLKYNKILTYGLVRYGETQVKDYENEEIYKIIFYVYKSGGLHDNVLFPSGLLEWIKNLVDPSKGDNYNIQKIRDEVYTNDGTYFGEMGNIYRLYRSCEFLKVIIKDYQDTIWDYNSLNKQVLEMEEKYGRDALTMISPEMLFEYRDTVKDDYEIEQLKAFLAIKSLQGNKDLIETNKETIAMRMVGAKNKKVLEEKLTDPTNKALYDKYLKRYHIDKLLNVLLEKEFIQSKLSAKRSLFISTKLSFKELPNAIKTLMETKRNNISTKEKQESAARQELLVLLKNPSKPSLSKPPIFMDIPF